MDYKYITQLLERYFECSTTLEEEAILRTFFSQESVPESLSPYRPLFVYESEHVAQNTLGDSFDERLTTLISREPAVKATVIPFTQRLRPLFRAAAVVAVVLTLGNAMQQPFADTDNAGTNMAVQQSTNTTHGTNMAKSDTVKVNTPEQAPEKRKQTLSVK